MKIFWRCALKLFSSLRTFTDWLSDMFLDCQFYCSRQIGDDPF